MPIFLFFRERMFQFADGLLVCDSNQRILVDVGWDFDCVETACFDLFYFFFKPE